MSRDKEESPSEFHKRSLRERLEKLKKNFREGVKAVEKKMDDQEEKSKQEQAIPRNVYEPDEDEEKAKPVSPPPPPAASAPPKKTPVISASSASASGINITPPEDREPLPIGKFVRIAVIIGGALLLLSIVRGFLTKKPALEQMISQEKSGGKDDVVAVKVFKVGRFNYEDPLNELGTIKGAVEFKLSFEIPGVISSVNYREGERYEEGALLMSLRQDDILLRLKRAQAQLNKAQAQVQINEEKVQEHEKLFAIGAIPKSTLDKVKLELDSEKYEMEAARLEVKAHESMLEKSNLYAPSAGMIGQLNIEEGETVTPNTLLGSHIMTEYVFAEFGVGERDVNKIALGQKARVFIDAYPDKTFEGVVENVSPVVAGTSRTATVRVRVENPEGLLLPGMFARIRILLYSKKNALVVQTDALQGTEEDPFVYVIKQQESVAEKRPVTVGYRRVDYAQIDAGLSEGETVAISGLDRLEDGKKIRIVEVQEGEI